MSFSFAEDAADEEQNRPYDDQDQNLDAIIPRVDVGALEKAIVTAPMTAAALNVCNHRP
jgi:hypothetical protein